MSQECRRVGSGQWGGGLATPERTHQWPRADTQGRGAATCWEGWTQVEVGGFSDAVPGLSTAQMAGRLAGTWEAGRVPCQALLPLGQRAVWLETTRGQNKQLPREPGAAVSRPQACRPSSRPPLGSYLHRRSAGGLSSLATAAARAPAGTSAQVWEQDSLLMEKKE